MRSLWGMGHKGWGYVADGLYGLIIYCTVSWLAEGWKVAILIGLAFILGLVSLTEGALRFGSPSGDD